MSLLLWFPPPFSLRALVTNAGSANVTPLSFSGGVWTAGSNVTVGTNPYSLGPSMIFNSR